MRGILIRLGKKLVKGRWLLVVSFLTIFLIPNIALASTITPEKIIELTNQKRIENSLSTLSISPKLSTAAQDKAFDMVNRNYWSHETPEGSPFWVFVNKRDYNWIYIGENLAADFNTAEGVVTAWYDSPSHRNNLLNENYTNIGVGIYKNIVVAEYGQEAKLPQENQDFIHTLSNNLFTFVFKLLDVFSF